MSDDGDQEGPEGLTQEIIDGLIADDVALLVIASVRDEKWARVIETLNRLALADIQQKQYQGALHKLRRALELTSPLRGNPNLRDTEMELILRSTTYNNLAVLHRNENRLREAWQYVNKALRLDMSASALASYITRVEAEADTASGGSGSGRAGAGAAGGRHHGGLSSSGGGGGGGGGSSMIGRWRRPRSNPAASHLNMCAVLSSMKRHKSALIHAECALGILSGQLQQLAREGDARPSPDTSAAIVATLQLTSVAFHNLAVEQEHLRLYPAATLSYKRTHAFAVSRLDTSSPAAKAVIKACVEATKCFVDVERAQAEASGGAAGAGAKSSSAAGGDGRAGEGEEGEGGAGEDAIAAGGAAGGAVVPVDPEAAAAGVMAAPVLNVKRAAQRYTLSRRNPAPREGAFVQVAEPSTGLQLLSGVSGAPAFVRPISVIKPALQGADHQYADGGEGAGASAGAGAGTGAAGAGAGARRLAGLQQGVLARAAAHHPDVVVAAARQNPPRAAFFNTAQYAAYLGPPGAGAPASTSSSTSSSSAAAGVGGARAMGQGAGRYQDPWAGALREHANRVAASASAGASRERVSPFPWPDPLLSQGQSALYGAAAGQGSMQGGQGDDGNFRSRYKQRVRNYLYRQYQQQWRERYGNWRPDDDGGRGVGGGGDVDDDVDVGDADDADDWAMWDDAIAARGIHKRTLRSAAAVASAMPHAAPSVRGFPSRPATARPIAFAAEGTYAAETASSSAAAAANAAAQRTAIARAKSARAAGWNRPATAGPRSGSGSRGPAAGGRLYPPNAGGRGKGGSAVGRGGEVDVPPDNETSAYLGALYGYRDGD